MDPLAALAFDLAPTRHIFADISETRPVTEMTSLEQVAHLAGMPL